MKRKIVSLLLVLVSIITCAICITACNGKPSTPAEYVGKYEFVSLDMAVTVDDSQDRKVFEAGKDGVDKDFIRFELKVDGTYKMTMSAKYMQTVGAVGVSGSGIEGEWSIADGKLKLHGSSTYDNGVLNGEYLTFNVSSKMNYGNTTGTAKCKTVFKKVSTAAPVE